MNAEVAGLTDAQKPERLVATGERFGRLVVGKRVGRDKFRNWLWECVCDCGKERLTSQQALKGGNTKSCGCLRVDRVVEARKRHGHAHLPNGLRSPEYNSWVGMKNRVRAKKGPNWAYYGSRGITMCERWRDFTNFLADMGLKPSPAHSLDRINNDGNYEPGNCRWATASEQVRNRRTLK